MDITQLLTGSAIILGVLLMTALAVVPLWLEHEAQQATRATPADVHTLKRTPADKSDRQGFATAA